MRISDWSSDVCSSDLGRLRTNAADRVLHSPACSRNQGYSRGPDERTPLRSNTTWRPDPWAEQSYIPRPGENRAGIDRPALPAHRRSIPRTDCRRSEEHTSELQSLMRISYAVFCLKNKKHTIKTKHNP